jgi:hypothetical protein
LLGVRPLVDGVVDVDALVTLQTDQPGVEDLSQDLADFGLPNPCLTFEQSSVRARKIVVARLRSAT